MDKQHASRGRLFGFAFLVGLAATGGLLTFFTAGMPRIFAQAQTQGLPRQTTPIQLDVTDGSSASYRVQEQLAGVNFLNDAVGTTQSVTGTLMLEPDGSVNNVKSKLTIDLRSLKSDQERRDGYIQKRTLETDKFPFAEFVPRRVQGLPSPFPTSGQAGFQLTGDMAIHGMTSEVTWTGVATFTSNQVVGRATTNFNFSTFGLMKPQLARVLSVDEKIQLEVVFKFKRAG